MRSTLVAVVLGALVAACGGPPAPTGPGRLTLGSIREDGAFAPVNDGDEVTLVSGAQGGFHVWMKFRAEEVAAGEVAMVRRARRLTDDKLVLKTMATQTMGAPGPGGFWELPMAVPMFMCPSPIGLSVIDQPIVFEILLHKGAGGPEVARGEITLVPRCPVGERAFCERICTG